MTNEQASSKDLKKNLDWFKETDPTIFLDASGLVEFLRCPRSWYIRNKLRLVPETESQSLTFGSALHRALELYHRTGAISADDLTAIVKEFKLDETNDHRNAAMLAEAIDEYINTPSLQFPTLVVNGKPVVENSFAIPFGGLVWCGRLDRIIELPNGAVAVQDFKTSSADSAQFWNEFEVSIAQTGYLWAASQAVGRDITTFVITAFFTRRTKTPSRWSFRIFLRDKWQFDEWKTLVHERVSQMREVAACDLQTVLGSAKHANLASCYSHKFGQCGYCSICRMPPQAREQLLGTLKPNTFSPIKWT